MIFISTGPSNPEGRRGESGLKNLKHPTVFRLLKVFQFHSEAILDWKSDNVQLLDCREHTHKREARSIQGHSAPIRLQSYGWTKG